MTRRAMWAALAVAVAMFAIVGVLRFRSGGDDLGRTTAERSCQDDADFDVYDVQQGIAIPRDFVPVAVTRCVFYNDSAGRVRVGLRAEGDLSALVTALKEKSHFGESEACPFAPFDPPVVLTLVNEAGLLVTPTAPTRACGEPYLSVLTAVQQLTWTEVSRTPPDFDEHGHSRDGCPAVAQSPVVTGVPPGPPPPVFPAAPVVTLCHYALVPSGGGRLFESARFRGSPLEKFRTAVMAAPMAVTCDRPPPNAVVIYPADGASGAPVRVEVGGCFRLLDQSGNLRQLDAAMVALLNITDPTIK